MAEYSNSAIVTVAAGQNVPFTEEANTGKPCIVHREGAGLVTLRGRLLALRQKLRGVGQMDHQITHAEIGIGELNEIALCSPVIEVLLFRRRDVDFLPTLPSDRLLLLSAVRIDFR